MRKRELGFEIIVIYSQSPSYVYLNRLFGRIAMLIYTVKPGDTVDSIAAAYGIPVSTIVYQNQIPYPYRLAIGEALLLPTPAGIFSPRSTIYAGGYAYPFISPWVLRETLPYLFLWIYNGRRADRAFAG